MNHFIRGYRKILRYKYEQRLDLSKSWNRHTGDLGSVGSLGANLENEIFKGNTLAKGALQIKPLLFELDYSR